MRMLGLSFLLSHHPPRLSIHSIQDGRQERSVSFSPTSHPDFRVTEVWWFRHENPPQKGPELPDFFKRNKTIVRLYTFITKCVLIDMCAHGSARLCTLTIKNATPPGPSQR